MSKTFTEFKINIVEIKDPPPSNNKGTYLKTKKKLKTEGNYISYFAKRRSTPFPQFSPDNSSRTKRKNTEEINRAKASIFTNLFYNNSIKQNKNNRMTTQYRFGSSDKTKAKNSKFKTFNSFTQKFSEQSPMSTQQKFYHAKGTTETKSKFIDQIKPDISENGKVITIVYGDKFLQSDINTSALRRLGDIKNIDIDDGYYTLKKFYNEKYHIKRLYTAKNSPIRKQIFQERIKHKEDEIKPWQNENFLNPDEIIF